MERFKPHKLKFRTKAACRVAGIDPQRLNEAIASKDGYPCAPKTSAGVARVFDEFDIIALFVFRRLTLNGFSQKLASGYACGVLSALRSNYHELPERIDFPMTGFNDEWIAASESDPPNFEIHHNMTLSANEAFCINISKLREIVRAAMEAEANVIGEE